MSVFTDAANAAGLFCKFLWCRVFKRLVEYLKEGRAMKKAKIDLQLQVLYMKEGDTFVCYSPALDLAAHGDNFEDAGKSFEVTLKLFVEEVTKKGTWPQVLKEYGWEKIHNEWTPPLIIKQDTKSLQIPLAG